MSIELSLQLEFHNGWYLGNNESDDFQSHKCSNDGENSENGNNIGVMVLDPAHVEALRTKCGWGTELGGEFDRPEKNGIIHVD